MRMVGTLLGLGLFFVASVPTPGLAQDASMFTNPVCGLINFRFCDQNPRPDAVPPPPMMPEAAAPNEDRHVEARQGAPKKLARTTPKQAPKKKPKSAPAVDDAAPSQE